MAKIDSGTSQERTQGPKGTLHVTFDCVDEAVLEGKEGRSDALRVRFMGEKGERISLGVPLSKVAYNKLIPFVNVPEALPHSAEGLTKVINDAMPKGAWWWVEVYNGWVTSIDPKDHDSMARVWCEPGTHRGYLHRMYKFYRADNAQRISFELLSLQHRFASFTAPWPKDMTCEIGIKPEDDYIGPKSALNPGVTMWKYLMQFGLDWDRFLTELAEGPALFTRPELDGEVLGYFYDVNDITPELTATVMRHGAHLVQWEMVVTPQYGLGIQRGATHQAEFLPVVSDDDDFKKVVSYTLAMWDLVAAQIMGRKTSLLNQDGTVSEDGKSIINGLWRPVINAYPDVSLAVRSDGLPAITFPITQAKWRPDGVAALSFMAERLMKLTKDELADPTGVCALRNNDQILPWVKENVPEFGMIKTEEEEVM